MRIGFLSGDHIMALEMGEGFEPLVLLTTNSSSRERRLLKDETESLVKALSLLRGAEGVNSLLHHLYPDCYNLLSTS
jgi:hypothetical protein